MAASPAEKKKSLDGKNWRQAVVIATGPSLKKEQVSAARASRATYGGGVIAVNDAWRWAAWADVLYATDSKWWRVSAPGPGEFAGQKWSTHNTAPRINDDKTEQAERHGLRLVDGAQEYGFSTELGRIHYGDNSGFAAINLALQFGARRVYLLGFDMHIPAGSKSHFFGEHPSEIRSSPDYRHYIGHFETAARMLEPGIQIINCTPGSAITCFPRGEL